jgi:hypothetical protein
VCPLCAWCITTAQEGHFGCAVDSASEGNFADIGVSIMAQGETSRMGDIRSHSLYLRLLVKQLPQQCHDAGELERTPHYRGGVQSGGPISRRLRRLTRLGDHTHCVAYDKVSLQR